MIKKKTKKHNHSQWNTIPLIIHTRSRTFLYYVLPCNSSHKGVNQVRGNESLIYLKTTTSALACILLSKFQWPVRDREETDGSKSQRKKKLIIIFTIIPFQSSDSIFIDDKKVHSTDNTIGNILYLDDLSEPVSHKLLHVMNSLETNWYNKDIFFLPMGKHKLSSLLFTYIFSR